MVRVKTPKTKPARQRHRASSIVSRGSTSCIEVEVERIQWLGS